MILTKEKLQSLNRHMTGLGAPTHRDDMGYNAGDFGKMEWIARYRHEIDDDMAYIIATTLRTYKNTQLVSYREDIEETAQYYEMMDRKDSLMKDQIPMEDFIERTVSLKEKGERPTLLVEGTVSTYALGIPYWKEVTVKGSEVTLPKEHLLDFVERLKEARPFPYQADAALSAYLKEIEKEIRENPKETLFIERENEQGYFLSFQGFCDIRDFIRKENEFLEEKIRWVSERGIKNPTASFLLYVPKEEIGYMYQKVTELGFLNKTLADVCKDKPLLSDEERKMALQEKKQEIYQDKNASMNTLIDVNDLTLPFTPYPFQLEDAKEIVSKKRMLLGHDMGAGKTFIAGLVGTSIDTPKLVVVPESLRLNWRKEILNITPNADVRILYSKDNYYDIVGERKPDWLITGYATATKYRGELLDSGFDCIFIDEVHNCKAVNNFGKPSSKRAEAILELCEDATYVYPMTGTPIPTRNKDLYNLFKLLDVNEVGDIQMGQKWSFYQYAVKYCDGYNNGFGLECNGNSHSEELHKALQPVMVRRLKKDVLPDLTKQRMFIPTESISREYKKIEKDLYCMGDNDTYMALAMKGRHVLSKEKVKIALDLCDSMLEEGRSVVLVSNFNDTLDTIMDKYKEDCCTIRGGMTDKQKQQAIDDFQAGKKTVCALNIVAGGVGVTLTKAHDMVIVDYDWTPSNMSQVEDRICRAGQTEGCNIHYIYCENSTLDTTFIDMITNKSRNIDKVVDGADNTMNMSGDVSFMKALQNKVEGENLKNFDKEIVPLIKEQTTVNKAKGGYEIHDVFIPFKEILSVMDKKPKQSVKNLMELIKEKEMEEITEDEFLREELMEDR